MDDLWESRNRDEVQRIGQEHSTARGTVEAARRLYSLLSRHPEFTSEEDFNLVRAIESQTDDLPLGQVRDLWDPVVLAEKDAESVRCEAL